MQLMMIFLKRNVVEMPEAWKRIVGIVLNDTHYKCRSAFA